jgi:GNAT superfamily N-acetyltransferase
MTDLIIRPAVESDVPVILELIRGLAEYERAPEQVVCDEAQLRESLFDSRNGARQDAEVLLACVGTVAAGFVVFFHNYSTWWGRRGIYLEDLFVRPEMRGRGIGKALLRSLAQIARDRDCARMEWSVLDWNKPAIDFYLSLGAVAKDEWTVYRLNRPEIEKLAQEIPLSANPTES